ncbi:hypothetical protein EHS25_005547 [Saitozyma podzolica]|uniref:Uncharacterized protein n=1 Tax=Saitozyma podzolica TaxID=1890683 RepID=A0A427XXU4_9TREE|nr:hypothetical protein EHS25_005547 [Saitozyma podzolica]
MSNPKSKGEMLPIRQGPILRVVPLLINDAAGHPHHKYPLICYQASPSQISPRLLPHYHPKKPEPKPAAMSSYDPAAEEGIITPEQFRESMRLVRLQLAVPISVLISVGTNLICALAIKPGLSGINALFPTLLSPNSLMIGLYWAVLYVLQVGFCLTLLLVRQQVTKDTLIHGVGLRFAIANWIQAAWAACFTLQFFIGAEIILLLNVINLISIHATLRFYPLTLKRPMDALFIHAPMVLLLATLFELEWLHNGFIALGWVIKDEYRWGKWTWQAVGSVGAVNVVVAIWEGVTRQ